MLTKTSVQRTETSVYPVKTGVTDAREGHRQTSSENDAHAAAPLMHP